jgi:hypothetical protein
LRVHTAGVSAATQARRRDRLISTEPQSWRLNESGIHFGEGQPADADHKQSRDVFTVMVPVPPAAGSSGVLFVADTSHLAPVGPTKLVLPDPHAVAAIATVAKTR